MDAINVLNSLQRISREKLNLTSSRIGTFHYFALRKSATNLKGAISPEVFCGIDMNPSTAILKACMEFVERDVFFSGQYNISSTDGMASYPVMSTSKAELNHAFHNARNNAVNEAYERFVWANWWDNLKVGHSLEKLSLNYLKNHFPFSEFLFQIDIEIDCLYKIKPFTTSKNKSLIIFFLKLKNFGYLSGGAAEENNNEELAEVRALSELVRHILAFTRIKNSKKQYSSYEKRLFYFASGKGNSEFEERTINHCEGEKILIPELIIDKKLSNIYDSISVTHYANFKGQPDFLQGAENKFCI